MRQDRFICSLTTDEHEANVLIIKPFHLKDFDNDSIYDFKMPSIYSTDGMLLNSHKIKYITAPSLAYASIEDVRANLGDVDLLDEKILYHIREASRLAEVIVAKAYEKQNIPFSKEDLMEYRNSIEQMKDEHWVLWQFVVLKAAYESLMSLYITMATRPDRIKEILSDLSKEITFNLKAIKDLLDDLKKRYEDIIEKIYTVADPKFALRGKLAVPIYPNMHAPYHGLNGMGGYGRSYNTTSYGGGQYGNRGGRF
ncbi:MAG: hypothetical protein RR406_00305 [Bacilli bacterium]